MAVTVKQIAKELDISFQLVSAVLNNKSYCRASKEKRKLILDTAAKMGYVPNVNARVLAGKSSFILGVLADLQAASPAAKILAQLEKVASLAGFRLLIGGFHNKVDDIISSYKLLKQHNVDGVFLISLDDLNYEKKLTDFFKDEKNIVVVRAPLMNQHFCVEVDLISAFNNIVNVVTIKSSFNILISLSTVPLSSNILLSNLVDIIEPLVVQAFINILPSLLLNNAFIVYPSNATSTPLSTKCILYSILLSNCLYFAI